MNKINPFFIIFLVIPLGGLFAQQKAENTITLNWGIGNIQRQDITFSNFVHKHWSPLNFALSFDHSRKWLHQACAKYGSYQPNTGETFILVSPFSGNDISTDPHKFTLVDINYALGKVVADQDKYKLGIGLRSRNRFNVSVYNFALFGHFGYYFSFGLDAWLHLEYAPSEKHQFSANLAIPFVSYNSRSPYLTADDQYFIDNYTHKSGDAFINYIKRGEIQSWDKSQSVDFDMAYNYTLTKKWDLGIRYWFSMSLNQIPTTYISFENIFSLSSRFKL